LIVGDGESSGAGVDHGVIKHVTDGGIGNGSLGASWVKSTSVGLVHFLGTRSLVASGALTAQSLWGTSGWLVADRLGTVRDGGGTVGSIDGGIRTGKLDVGGGSIVFHIDPSFVVTFHTISGTLGGADGREVVQTISNSVSDLVSAGL